MRITNAFRSEFIKVKDCSIIDEENSNIKTKFGDKFIIEYFKRVKNSVFKKYF